MQNRRLLKKDQFGEIWLLTENGENAVLRDTRSAVWWVAWLARVLLRREARALAALRSLDGTPRLIKNDKYTLARSYMPGVPMFEGRPRDSGYFRAMARLSRSMHRLGVVHNDLAKEPNLLVRDDGSPAFVDFQLAWTTKRRGRLFRAAAREDIRHLLKHKRTYRPDLLTAREHSILNTPSTPSRAWMSLAKPVYLFVTRRLFGWSDREGAADRGRRNSR